jgi:hypothetical protein
MTNRRRIAFVIPVLAIVACTGADEPPKVPLGHPSITSTGGATAGTTPTIDGEARVALDSGNTLYRAKSYPLALDQYRRAALLAPGQDVPLFGMLMVASATNDSRLADSVTALMRALRPPAAPGTTADSALTDIHAGVLPPAHPPLPATTP